MLSCVVLYCVGLVILCCVTRWRAVLRRVVFDSTVVDGWVLRN